MINTVYHYIEPPEYNTPISCICQVFKVFVLNLKWEKGINKKIKRNLIDLSKNGAIIFVINKSMTGTRLRNLFIQRVLSLGEISI